ncbi:MAG: hypothetical protein WAM89_20075 [Terriglobales bacterium]
MKECSWIEPIVERVVGRVLDGHTAQLSSEIVHRVMEELASAPRPDESLDERSSASFASEHAASVSLGLANAVAEIQMGSTQREILCALLDASARYASRVALFVVKGSHATGWQGRGFSNNDTVKDFALDESTPAVVLTVGRTPGDRLAANVTADDFDARFLAAVGTPATGEGCILPLILKDKVAALVYADSGADGRGWLDAGALELLALTSSSWLEVNSLRKQMHKEPPSAHADAHSMTPAEVASAAAAQPVPAIPALNDPFAAHAPTFATGQAMAAVAAASTAGSPPVVEETSPAVEVQNAIAEVPSMVSADTAEAATPPIVPMENTNPAELVSTSSASMSDEDQETHRKAQRFARLLVDEIKLYNQAKVAEGRNHKDLYDRLKEVIEKSRVTYQKRYGSTIAASANYFDHEIIRSLAEDDPSIMGANFKR